MGLVEVVGPAEARYIKGERRIYIRYSVVTVKCSTEMVEESAEEDEGAEDEVQPPGNEDEEGPGDSIDGDEERSVDG